MMSPSSSRDTTPTPRWGRLLVLASVSWLALVGVVWVMCFTMLPVLLGFDVELNRHHVFFLKITAPLFRVDANQIIKTMKVVCTAVSLHLGALFAFQSSRQGDQQAGLAIRILVMIVALLPRLVALLICIVVIIDLLKLIRGFT